MYEIYAPEDPAEQGTAWATMWSAEHPESHTWEGDDSPLLRMLAD